MDGAVVTASLIVDRLVGMFGMVLVVPLGIVPLFDWFKIQQTSGELLFGPALLIAATAPLKKLWGKTVNIFHKIFLALKFWWQHPISLMKSLVFYRDPYVMFF